MQTSPRSRLVAGAAFAAFLLPVAFSAVAYRPLLDAYFRSDDFLNLYRIVNEDPLRYVLTPHGGHLLWTRNAVFYAFFQAFGTRAELYYAAVLATHLLNVGLLFAVLRRWTDSLLLAAFGATIWGICPVQSGALEWYSVYGQVIVATILLVLLFQVAGVVNERSPLHRSVTLLWPLLLLVASSSFGVGIALTLVLPVALFLLLPPSPARRRLCVVLGALALAIPFLYRGTMALYTALYGLSPEVWRADLVATNLHYGHSALMSVQLICYGILRLLLGFAYNPRFFPASFLYVGLALFAAFVVLSLRGSGSTMRRQLSGLFLLSLASYGLISLGRGAFFEIAQMPRAAATARYHYVATLPLVVMLCIGLRALADSPRLPAQVKAFLFVLWLTVAIVSFQRARPFIVASVGARIETGKIRAAVDEAVNRAAEGETVYIENRPFRSVGSLLIDDPKRFPGWAGAFVFLFPSNTVAGRQVRFIENDPDVRKALRHGKRTADLLVAAAEADAGP